MRVSRDSNAVNEEVIVRRNEREGKLGANRLGGGAAVGNGRFGSPRHALPLAVCLLLVYAAFFAGCATAPSAAPGFELKVGDLLFQDLDAGPLSEAIEKVTQGVHGANFSHVGMVVSVDGRAPLIIEAVGAGVVETPLSQFLARSEDELGNPKVIAGRLRPEYRHLIKPAADAARTHLGAPYDSVYVLDDDAYYCSELLYEAFREANGGSPVFELAPMTFVDPDTGETFPAWAAYYEELGHPIPEGEPGLNPGGMSRSPKVQIVHRYGIPSGWRESGE
jgi:hypothetical protein